MPSDTITAGELMQKLALSRAAQQAGGGGGATFALARGLYRTPSGGAPPAAAAAGAGDSAGPKAAMSGMTSEYLRAARSRDRGRSAAPAVAGFNSFMGEALLGWRDELASVRLRQAVLAEFVGTGARARGRPGRATRSAAARRNAARSPPPPPSRSALCRVGHLGGNVFFRL